MELPILRRHQLATQLRIEVQLAQIRLIPEQHATGGDRPHCHLRRLGVGQLAHGPAGQGQLQGFGQSGCHHHAAAGQADHHGRRITPPALHRSGQRLTGLPAVVPEGRLQSGARCEDPG